MGCSEKDTEWIQSTSWLPRKHTEILTLLILPKNNFQTCVLFIFTYRDFIIILVLMKLAKLLFKMYPTTL